MPLLRCIPMFWMTAERPKVEIWPCRVMEGSGLASGAPLPGLAFELLEDHALDDDRARLGRGDCGSGPGGRRRRRPAARGLALPPDDLGADHGLAGIQGPGEAAQVGARSMRREARQQAERGRELGVP